MRSDRERLLDISDAISAIDKYTARGRAAFEEDELVQTWIVRHLQILGGRWKNLHGIPGETS